MRRFLGQLKAIWDLARQLVELGEKVEYVIGEVQTLVAEIQRIDERTRKQDYRSRKAEEHAVFAPPATAAAPGGARADMIRAARAKGLLL